MNRRLLLTMLVLGMLTLAFAKTKLLVSWKNPKYTGQTFHNILVIGMSNNPGTRADFEDALSARITRPGIESVAGNTILYRPEGSKVDLDYIRTQVREFKIDAVVVSRLVKVQKDVTYVPGGYYGSFYGYYGAVYPVVYSPGYLQTETTVRVETNFYSVTAPDGELIWTGTSDTFDPSSAHKVIDGLVKLVVEQLEKEQVLPKSPK